MKKGDVVQATELIKGKNTTYAAAMDLLKIISVNHLPVVLVEHFDTKQTFPVRENQLTTELHPKNKAKIKKQNGN